MSGLLAKVQIARRQLALAEDDYRAILVRVAGRTSSKDCTERQLEAVLGEFKRLGWMPKKGSARVSNQPHVRKIYALWREACQIGAFEDTSKTTLFKFVERQTRPAPGVPGKGAPEFCSSGEANKVSEGLKAMTRRAEAKR